MVAAVVAMIEACLSATSVLGGVRRRLEIQQGLSRGRVYGRCRNRVDCESEPASEDVLATCASGRATGEVAERERRGQHLPSASEGIQRCILYIK